MTIATLLGTTLIFLSLGMGGDAYQGAALCVGAIVCIAAANAGATSQDLKTGYLVGATPIRQQIGLIIGVVVSVSVIGFTIIGLHESNYGPIGESKLPAPQGTLMATIIKGVLSQDLPWGLSSSAPPWPWSSSFAVSRTWLGQSELICLSLQLFQFS